MAWRPMGGFDGTFLWGRFVTKWIHAGHEVALAIIVMSYFVFWDLCAGHLRRCWRARGLITMSGKLAGWTRILGLAYDESTLLRTPNIFFLCLVL